MSARPPDAAARAVDPLVRRYLDPRRRWTLADDARARALREDPAARRAWAVAIATHRALVGAPDGLPSGIEQRRQVDLALAHAGLAAAPAARAPWSWLRIVAPLSAAALALIVALNWNTTPDTEDWIQARGMKGLGPVPAQVGLGVGGITEAGSEYEAISSGAVHLEDWLRLSYTNQRQDLGWLFVVGLQRDGDRVVTRAIAPLPEEGQSLAVTTGRFVTLPFEARLSARHTAGALRLVALFTARPLTVAEVERALADLASSALDALPSEVEARLRDRLRLGAGDVVQLLDTRIVPGSAAPTLPREDAPEPPRQETP